MWTTHADVLAKLRRRWESGELLSAFADDAPLLPLEISLRTPTSRDLAANFDAVQRWGAEWRKHDGLRIDYHRVGGRLVGANELPRRVWIDEWDQLWSMLRVGSETRRFAGLFDQTRAVAPAVTEWMLRRPMNVLALSQDWTRIVETALWIAGTAPGSYLRYVDVPGVDTKFIERHRSVIARLLDLQLPPDRIDTACPPADFIGRYRFRRKPQYVRFRWLDPHRRTGGFTELTARLDELADTPLAASTVVIVENDTTYLALPEMPDAVAIFGGGYSLTRLDGLPWLADRDIRYWGDIDSHGFAILDRLRKTFPHTESVLMDRATLLSHESQWVREQVPVVTTLGYLRPLEAALYRDLVEDTFGPAVRLEQERIRYSAVGAALLGRA